MIFRKKKKRILFILWRFFQDTMTKIEVTSSSEPSFFCFSSGTLCLQANTTTDLRTGTQAWLGTGIRLILGLTEILLVRVYRVMLIIIEAKPNLNTGYNLCLKKIVHF